MKKKILLNALPPFIILLLICTNSYAQTTTNLIGGIITDVVTGSAIPSVTVYLTNTSTGTTDSTTTSSTGRWKYDLSLTSVEDNTQMPSQFEVSQNYPNPFNPSTKVDVWFPESGSVRAAVYNAIGQLIDERDEFVSRGYYSIEWSARGSAGVYFMNIKTKDGSVTKKMVLLDGSRGSGLSAFRPGNKINQLNKRLSKIQSPVSLSIKTYKLEYMPYNRLVTVSGGETVNFQLETIHSNCTLADLHNDILEVMSADTSYHWATQHTYNNTDIPRLKTGGVDVQLFAAWVDPAKISATNYFNQAEKMVTILKNELARNTSTIGQAFTKSDVDSLNINKKIAGILAVEGGHAIENNLDNLKTLYNDGMRYMTITWNNSTDWAVSAQDSRSTTVGLTDFGKTVIRTMDSLGILIDVAHTGIKTIEDILAVTKNPIIDTHTGARALRNHYRDLYDDQIKAIAKSGGVMGVVFYPPFLSSGSANIATVVSHIDYIVKLVGIDYVALGSDFDGIGTNYVTGLEDVSKFPALTLALLNKGYTQSDVRKILGGNFLRVFEKVCGTKK